MLINKIETWHYIKQEEIFYKKNIYLKKEREIEKNECSSDLT